MQKARQPVPVLRGALSLFSPLFSALACSLSEKLLQLLRASGALLFPVVLKVDGKPQDKRSLEFVSASKYDVPISLGTLDYDLLQSPYFALDILRILIAPLLEAL